MDSKTVNKRIRSEIRPLLKTAGFSRFTARNSWRYTKAGVEVINFQSFNSYNASVMGCSTYSFSVNLGSYFSEIPDEYGGGQVKQKAGELRPDEWQCHFRGGLHRSFSQPEYESRDVWYIDPEGRYIEKALHDVRMAIVRDGLPWFERLSDRSEALRILTEENERMRDLWGFGGIRSPIRHYLTGYLAFSLGRYDTAASHLREALHSGCFGLVRDRLERDLAQSAELELAPDGPLRVPQMK